jgi:hypothetical protein
VALVSKRHLRRADVAVHPTVGVAGDAVFHLAGLGLGLVPGAVDLVAGRLAALAADLVGRAVAFLADLPGVALGLLLDLVGLLLGLLLDLIGLLLGRWCRGLRSRGRDGPGESQGKRARCCDELAQE